MRLAQACVFALLLVGSAAKGEPHKIQDGECFLNRGAYSHPVRCELWELNGLQYMLFFQLDGTLFRIENMDHEVLWSRYYHHQVNV